MSILSKKERDRKYYLKNKEKKLRTSKEWAKRNPEKHREQSRRSSKKWDLKRCEKLAGCPKPERCEVCGSSLKICFDHDHKTGKFRGWICDRCNRILGFAKDDSKLLRDLANLIDSSNGRLKNQRKLVK
ncbi:MAG: endonuclease domain-containing protein [Nanoarchaeota archaeon]|mgnify:CR=1 FL=1